MGMEKLNEIKDIHAEGSAKIAGIVSDFEFERSGGIDDGCIIIRGKTKRGANRSLRIYYNGSNTRVLHNTHFEVLEYCHRIFEYLKGEGYDIDPHREVRERIEEIY